MSDIEAEIRRQMLEERDRALRNQPPPPPGAVPGTPPPPAGPSYNVLPPPSFPQGGPTYPPHYPPATPPPPYSAPQRPSPALPPGRAAAPNSAKRKGAVGGVGAIGLAIAKFWGAIKALLIGLKFLSFGKYFFTAGSMLISILAYAALFGWRFGVGLVALIFIHELGHALAIKHLGYEVKAMVFIPLLGAYVQRERIGSAAERAQISIMGPVAGMVAGLACGAVYGMTGSPFWLALSFFSFYMNLFNLSAIPFLDGGRVASIVPPRWLLAGMVAVAAINYRFPLCWLMVLFAVPLIVERWRAGTIDPALVISKKDQQIYSVAYFGLMLFLGFASLVTQDWLWELSHLGRRF